MSAVEEPISITSLRKGPQKTSRFTFRLPSQDLIDMARAAEALGILPPEFVRRAIREKADVVLAAAEKPKPASSRKKKS